MNRAQRRALGAQGLRASDRVTVTIAHEVFSVTVEHEDMDVAREVCEGVRLVWQANSIGSFDLDCDEPQDAPQGYEDDGSPKPPGSRFTAQVGHPDAESCHRYAMHLVRVAEQMQAAGDTRGAQVICTMPEHTISSEVITTVRDLMDRPRQ